MTLNTVTAAEDALAGRAQQAAEDHLAACEAALWREEEGEDGPESPAHAPYDGCDTCMVREVLAAVWPILRPDAGAA
jgi:hypothetical protein